MWIVVCMLALPILALAALDMLWKNYPCTLVVYIEYDASFNGSAYDFSKYKDTNMILLTIYTEESFEEAFQQYELTEDEEDMLYENEDYWRKPKVYKNAVVIRNWKGEYLCRY